MRDILFFPGAFILAVAMVWLAILPGFGRLPVGAVAGDGQNYDRIVIEGPYLNKIIAGGDARSELRRLDNGSYELLLAHQAGSLKDAPELGPHFRLAADIEQQLQSRRIRVIVRARPADDQGSEALLVNYSAGRSGESGWQRLPLQSGFSEVSFEYAVPPRGPEQGVDYLGLRAEVPQKSRGVIIDRVIIERIG